MITSINIDKDILHKMRVVIRNEMHSNLSREVELYFRRLLSEIDKKKMQQAEVKY